MPCYTQNPDILNMAPKKGSSKHPIDEKEDLATRITEHPYFQWFVARRHYIPYVSLAILLVIFLAFKFFTGKAAKTESNYLLAENYFSMIQRSIRSETGTGNREQALTKLKTITDSYPELHSRYDGLIAQLLITQGDSAGARPYADRTFSRTAQNKLPYYSDFSHTTLLIANDQHQQALEKAIALKDLLIEHAAQNKADPQILNFGDSLFAYNLLRIAMLKKELGSPEEELQAWKEWKQYARIDDQSPPNDFIAPEAFIALNNQVGEDNFSLLQYIEAREKELLEKSKGNSHSQ